MGHFCVLQSRKASKPQELSIIKEAACLLPLNQRFRGSVRSERLYPGLIGHFGNLRGRR
jgi:hypothetical protein